MIRFHISIPAYNYESGLKNILNSIPLLDDKIFIIISDNTRSKKIYNLYLKFSNLYKKKNIHYSHNKPESSPVKNWNYSLYLSKKNIKKLNPTIDYNILLHQDEYFSKDFFKNLLSIIQKNNYPDVISCSTLVFYKNKFRNKIHTTASQRKFFFKCFFFYILYRNFIGPVSSLAIKRKNKNLTLSHKFKWLIDVAYFINLYIITKKWFFTDKIYVYSDQRNSYSLTLSLKKKIKLIYKKEFEILYNKIKFSNKFFIFKLFKLLDYFIWVHIRIYNKIKLIFYYKRFLND